MAWTAPSTAVAGTILTASFWNIHVRDNELAIAAASVIIDRDVSAQTVENTVTETTVYTSTIPGGTLSTDKAIRFTHIADYLNNAGGSPSLTVRIKYGGTTFAGGTAITYGSTATRRQFRFEMLLSAFNATNAQVAETLWRECANGAPPGWDTSAVRSSSLLTGAVDSTADQTLAMTVEHSQAHADVEYIAKITQVEVLGRFS